MRSNNTWIFQDFFTYFLSKFFEITINFHMLHRFMERGDEEEIMIVQTMMSNFLRLLQRLNEPIGEEE